MIWSAEFVHTTKMHWRAKGPAKCMVGPCAARTTISAAVIWLCIRTPCAHVFQRRTCFHALHVLTAQVGATRPHEHENLTLWFQGPGRGAYHKEMMVCTILLFMWSFGALARAGQKEWLSAAFGRDGWYGS